MTELSFTKSFLSTLDARPVKLPSDHVYDPHSFSMRVPFTLPRLAYPPHPPMPKKRKTNVVPGSSKSAKLRLKSARNPVLDITLDNVPLVTTTVDELKEAVQDRLELTGEADKGQPIPLDKIKILWKRKPVGGKTVAEVLVDEPELLGGGKEVEFGVMVLGGASAVQVEPRSKKAEAEAQIAAEDDAIEDAQKPVQGPSGEEVLNTDKFWDDLEGFLKLRIKDEAEAIRLRALFRLAYQSG